MKNKEKKVIELYLKSCREIIMCKLPIDRGILLDKAKYLYISSLLELNL